MVTIQEPQEMTVHCTGHQSQILRSEIEKGNHRADQEAKKADYIPTDKTQAVLKALGLIEEMPQPCYAKKENWAKHKGLISLRGWYMLDKKIMIPQAQQWKITKALFESWRRKWQPTPIFLPGEFHGERSLVGYSPRGRKESDTTEQLN